MFWGRKPPQLVGCTEMRECWQKEKKETRIRRRRGLLEGYHEYEHWLHHAIITKLLAAPWRMRALDSTHLSCCPPSLTGLRLSTHEGCPAKDRLIITPVSKIKEAAGRKSSERGGSKVPAKWFKVMFDNEFQVTFACIASLHLNILFWGGPPDAKQFVTAVVYSLRSSGNITLLQFM